MAKKMRTPEERSIDPAAQQMLIRADEIGVPICITVDHQSVDDGTVTLRQRDDGSQTRVNISDLPG